MTCGLVHASYSLTEWQTVKLTFFAPWKSGPTIHLHHHQSSHTKLKIQTLTRPPTTSTLWFAVIKGHKTHEAETIFKFCRHATRAFSAGIQANQCSWWHGLQCSLICFTGHEVNISAQKKHIKARKVSSMHDIYCINYNCVLIKPIFYSFWFHPPRVVGHVELNLHLVPSLSARRSFCGAGIGAGNRKGRKKETSPPLPYA